MLQVFIRSEANLPAEEASRAFRLFHQAVSCRPVVKREGSPALDRSVLTIGSRHTTMVNSAFNQSPPLFNLVSSGALAGRTRNAIQASAQQRGVK